MDYPLFKIVSTRTGIELAPLGSRTAVLMDTSGVTHLVGDGVNYLGTLSDVSARPFTGFVLNDTPLYRGDRIHQFSMDSDKVMNKGTVEADRIRWDNNGTFTLLSMLPTIFYQQFKVVEEPSPCL